ncbi:MAG: PAS domain S-box protein [Syntrophales bacterium LBB04]|nr:PAS domain S-box protein [Syntrophales bacterium LBB04]
MKNKLKSLGNVSQSMIMVSLGLGAIYWIIDTLLYALNTGGSSTSSFLSPGVMGIMQRLIVLCFLIIFGSHVQYTVKKKQEAEEALHKTEERYRTLVETSTDAIISVNESMEIIHWNRAASDLFGYSKELIMGKALDLLIPEKFKQRHRESVRRFLDTGKTSFVGNTAELEGLRKDGTTRPMEVSLSANKEMGSWTFTAIVRETTERRRALEALRESEERYRNLFEDTKDAVLIWTAEGKILGVNQATLETFGADIEDMTGSDIAEIYDDSRDLAQFQEKLDREGAVRGYELHLKKKAGGRLDCLFTATVRKAKDGTILGYQGVVRDVTELKRNENKLKQTLDKLHKSMGGITQAMSTIVESRDPYTAGHQTRVAALARAIAQEMGLTEDHIDAVRMAGTLHDIGKIAVPAEILTNPGRLTKNAFEIIKDHPQTGHDILQGIEFPWPVADIILQHHEHMDGSGYPQGLTGENILMESRIISVADVVESMASHRPYRPGLGIDAALEEIEKKKNIYYDTAVVTTCLTLFNEKGYKMI